MKTCPTCNQALPPDKLELAGIEAANSAERLWKLDIFDPAVGSTHPRAKECLTVIEGIIKRNGWSWALPYLGDGPPQWCGMTAGDCWLDGGLDPTWLRDYFASTYRLRLWAKYQKFSVKSKPNPEPPPGAPRRLLVDLKKTFDPSVPRAGDIVIVGDGDPTVGDHVTICVGYQYGVFDTISGNSGGTGPNGDRRQGVSRRAYSTRDTTGYRPLWLIRPAATDLL